MLFFLVLDSNTKMQNGLIEVAAGDSLGIRARAENPFFSGISRKGRKTKIVTSCDNVFLTNVLLAWSRAPRKASGQNGNQSMLR